MSAQPVIRWEEGGEQRQARWHSEAGWPAPKKVTLADDRTTAEKALGQLRQGAFLLYRGDYMNARQLLAALSRRLRGAGRSGKPKSPLQIFREQRDLRAKEHQLLTRLLVPLDGAYKVALRRGPDLREACEPVWGPPDGTQVVVPLRELLGMVGAAQWRKQGVKVAGLKGKVHPHFGVFAPTRGEYPALLAKAPSPEGKRVFDLGTGTGVLGLLLLSRGAKEVVATDVDPRAVACALDNAVRLGFADRFRAVEADVFPEGRADLVVCNPPWLPEQPRTALDRAVYDPGGAFLARFLAELPAHLEEGGEGWLILSDLAERLGLRKPQELEEAIAGAGLQILWTHQVKAGHPGAEDADDPLFRVRAEEMVRLFALAPAR